MSLGQASEVVMMLLMPLIFRRFRLKTILAAGLLAWTIRYAFLAAGDPGPGMWMFYMAILLHGVCFDFFTVTGQIYTDQEAPPELRSTAQGFLTFLTYGVGMFAGSILSGIAVDFFTSSAGRNWRGFWLTSSIGSLAIFLFVAAAFRSRNMVRSKQAIAAAEA
jgi:MFS family permease